MRTESAYLALKIAQKRYGKALSALQPDALSEVRQLAEHQFTQQSRVLLSDEAMGVVVPAESLDAAISQIRGRYQSDDEFAEDLAKNGLDVAAFEAAMARELKVDAILEKVAARAADVSDVDVELYYLCHPDQFRRPETRAARHILLTINESYPENTRAKSMERIAAIAARLAKDPDRFAEQALKHSECPTALQGGVLGDLPRGTLYPELDAALFSLQAGDISGIVESPLGFHLLRCDAITVACVLTQEQAHEHVRRLLEQKRRRLCQKAWLTGLQDLASKKS